MIFKESVAMNILKCPVCAGALELHEKILRCENNHCFDMAKEGYVNLLSARKSGDNTGDNKDMAKSRRDFLNKGYYQPLAQAVCDCIQHYSDDGGSVLDICCGEGYYTAYCAERLQRDFYGFDLSKNMVRLAAKRNCGARFFVANIASIPVRDGAVQAAFHLFAPFHAPEFRRILSDNGVIMTAIPGRNHLFGLKQVLYDAPYYNDEKEPDAEGLAEITLGSQQDINALFQMTPYYYHTPTDGMNRLQRLDMLTTPIEFVLIIYKKK